MTAVAPKLRAEAERVRANYDIQDQALAERLRVGLVAIALLQGRAADARVLIAESRAATNKPQLKAIGMMMQDAAAAEIGTPAGQACARAGQRIDVLLASASPTVIRDEALLTRLQAEVLSAPFLAGFAKEEMDPAAATNGGQVRLLDGLTLARWRAGLETAVPCRNEISATVQRWATAPANQPANIWLAREPAATAFASAKPVVVAVWDAGIDPTAFPGQLAFDPAEPIDGRDNDGNGIVDDWNGPTYDAHMMPVASPLKQPSAELAKQLSFQMALNKGNGDLRYGYDTAEARLFAQRAREASVEEQALDNLLYEEVGGRNHGTAVGSEIADGAPYVRLYGLSPEPWGNDPREVVVDEAMNDRWVAAVDRLAARFHSAHVRVVNMSWGYTVDEISDKLTRYGGVTDQAVATARAKAMWAKADAAMRRLLAACPDVLFVNSAGNSNQSDEIFSSTPQTIGAPNLLIVGAAGTSGLPTAFTTYGQGVGIYGWGETVPLRVIGGMNMAMSGTSMSSPLVARAAAQMLAVNPRLTPEQVITGIKATATDANGLKLLHAANAVAWAKAR